MAAFAPDAGESVGSVGKPYPPAPLGEKKPSWFVVAEEDRAIPPALEKAEAARMKATTINVAASHLVMISHPKEVADLIEKAATSVAQR